MTQAVQLAQYGANNVGLSFKNRIINGDFTIDQRNNGASISVSGGAYTLDRWVYDPSASLSWFTFQQNGGAVTPPPGFSTYLGITSTGANTPTAGQFTLVSQFIEGFNFADMQWGTANAQPVTLSFWVRSSLTGTFGGALGNSAFNRSYPFTYTIAAANTWEYKTITVPGDTTGTWIGATNGIGLRVIFGLGVGSNSLGPAGAWAGATYRSATGATNVSATSGATFYITGVQLEKGSVATSFDYLPIGTELMLCQRYFQRIGSNFYGAVEGTSTYNFQVPYWMPMRASATVSGVSGGIFSVRYAGDTNITNPTLANITSGDTGVWLQVVSSGLVNGTPIYGRSQNTGSNNFLAASAEL